MPKLTPERSPIEEELDLATFKAVWLGQQHHEYGEMAVTETMGIALYTMGVVSNFEEAMQKQKYYGKHEIQTQKAKYSPYSLI